MGTYSHQVTSHESFKDPPQLNHWTHNCNHGENLRICGLTMDCMLRTWVSMIAKACPVMSCPDAHGGHNYQFIEACRGHIASQRAKQIGQLFWTSIWMNRDSNVDCVSQWTLEGFSQPWSKEINSMAALSNHIRSILRTCSTSATLR